MNSGNSFLASAMPVLKRVFPLFIMGIFALALDVSSVFAFSNQLNAKEYKLSSQKLYNK